MTDISTYQQFLALPSSLTRSLRLPLTLLKYLFRSPRRCKIDPRYTSEHLLKDIGLHR